MRGGLTCRARPASVNNPFDDVFLAKSARGATPHVAGFAIGGIRRRRCSNLAPRLVAGRRPTMFSNFRFVTPTPIFHFPFFYVNRAGLITAGIDIEILIDTI